MVRWSYTKSGFIDYESEFDILLRMETLRYAESLVDYYEDEEEFRGNRGVSGNELLSWRN